MSERAEHAVRSDAGQKRGCRPRQVPPTMPGRQGGAAAAAAGPATGQFAPAATLERGKTPASEGELSEQRRPGTPAAAAAAGSLVSRPTAARILGVRVSMIRRMQERGELRSVKRDGAHFFRKADLLDLRPTRTTGGAETKGARAAEVFALLDAGEDIKEIVIRTRIDPETVEKLADTWKRLNLSARSRGGVLVVPKEELLKLYTLAVSARARASKPETPEELIWWMKDLIDEVCEAKEECDALERRLRGSSSS